MRAYTTTRSAKLDWCIVRMEATRGWRRTFWRLMKRYYEMGI